MTHFAQPHHHQTDYSYPFVHPQLSPAWPPPLTPHTASHELDLDLGLADVKVHTGSTDDLTLAKPHHHQLPPSFYSDSSAGAAASCRPTTSASGFSFFPRGIADQLPPLVPTHPPPHQQVPPNMQLQPPYDDRSQPYLLPAPIDNVQASAVDVDESVGPAMTEHPGVLVDMNMAEHGSTAAKAGIQTPIASWLVWLWYAKPRLQPNGGTSSPPDLGDPFRSPPLSDIDPQQLTPSPKFIDFVNMLLRVTMVSHSVTLVALLYIHRLKSRNYLPAGAGTEQRPFIASLILGNKYLDDNTYTNKTWADLTNLPTAEINKMESEFLQGLKFNLSISKAEFEAWRKLLDSYIYHRERAFNPMMPYVSPALSRTPDTPAYMPITATTETFRSYSESPPNNRNGSAGFYRGAAVYEHGRKRSAVDAFATDVVTPAALYESLRQPASRAQLHIPPPTQVIPDGPRTAHTPSVGMDGSLGRSSSLTRSNRQMARFPGRRGSIGGTPSHFVPSQEDLRHTATQHAAMNAGLGIVMDQGMSNMQVQAQMQAAQLEHGYGALMRPYDGAPVPMIPPEGMEYYSASARAHPGQDGAPRKAILRHQAPVQPFVTPHPPPYTHTPAPSMMMSGQQTPWYPSPGDIDLMTPGATPAGPSTAPTMVPTQYPHAQQMGHAPHYSIPGNFANAGPAAYLYEPSATFQYNGTPAHAPPHNHSQHNLHSNMQGLEQYRWQTRSEWSSPNLPHGGYRY